MQQLDEECRMLQWLCLLFAINEFIRLSNFELKYSLYGNKDQLIRDKNINFTTKLKILLRR